MNLKKKTSTVDKVALDVDVGEWSETIYKAALDTFYIQMDGTQLFCCQRVDRVVSVPSGSTVTACPTDTNHPKTPNIAGRVLIGCQLSKQCLCAMVRQSTEAPPGPERRALLAPVRRRDGGRQPGPLLRLNELFWGIWLDASLGEMRLP